MHNNSNNILGWRWREAKPINRPAGLSIISYPHDDDCCSGEAVRAFAVIRPILFFLVLKSARFPMHNVQTAINKLLPPFQNISIPKFSQNQICSALTINILMNKLF
jgi:hypothetical protein